VYAALLHPRRYWLPNALPFLGLGATAYRTDYPLAQYDGWMAPMGHRLLGRLDATTAQRRAAAERYQRLLPWGPKLQAIVPRQGAVPAYLRFPVLIHPEYRDAVLTALRANGIGATASYPTAISDVPELHSDLRVGDWKGIGGQEIARRILTLPTHGYVTDQDQDRTVNVFASVLGV
jgi:dTDP-4-amino-4,6-dideoxygalactose transaminase